MKYKIINSLIAILTALSLTFGGLGVTSARADGCYALSFDGVNDYVVTTPPTDIPVGNSSYTIEAWIMPNAMGTYGIVGWGNYGTVNQVNALRLTGDPGIFHYWWGNDLIVYTASIAGAWHHLAVTYDGTDRMMYLDGALIGQDAPVGHNVPSGNNFRIGSTNNGEYFNGQIDEVRIWNVARSGAQISGALNTRLVGDETGLVALYRFGEGSGTSTSDDASTPFSGTLTNGPTWVSSGTSTPCDPNAPTLTSFTLQNPATSPTNADTLVFRATFSEDVQNVDTTDFAVNSTTTASVTNVTQVTPMAYNVTISGGNLAAFNGTVNLNLAGGQNITDLADNPLPPGEPGTDETYVLDNAGPPVPARLPDTGFPMGMVTQLPAQPDSKAYISTDLVLDIPSLNVKMNIVGVPQSETSWDVTWLGNSAGWLNGSAYPTWAGNTVLTGHVWDAYNQPGPFANLKSLNYGDRIIIHAYGQTYTYEVRESSTVTSKNVVSVFEHETLDWVTLVTCEFYNSFNSTYYFRRVVRAVLVSVN